MKKEALRQAGIGYHEVVAGATTPAELRGLVGRLVERPEPGSRVLEEAFATPQVQRAGSQEAPLT